MEGRWRRSVVAGAIVLWCGAAATASAQTGDVAAAADAYSRAQQAELREQWEQAAELYSLADRIAPTPEALRSAARAAQRAGLTATAATRAYELEQRYPDDAESRALAESILHQTESLLARIEAHCDRPCQIVVDGRLATDRMTADQVLFMRPGRRAIAASFEDDTRTPEQPITARAGERTELRFAHVARAATVASAASSGAAGDQDDEGSGGISPWFFGSALAITGVFGALTIWSGVEVLDANSRYDRAAPDAEMRYQEGRNLETRTNVFIGLTAAFALTSLVFAIVTDWNGDESPQAAAGGRSGPTLAFDSQSLVLGWSGTLR